MTKLSEPLKIKGITVKNRICVPPLVCYGWVGEDGIVTDKNVEHYRAMARGGAGLIIQEATCICPEGRISADQLGIWSDAHIPGLKRIVDAVHGEGVPIFIQLHHAGVIGGLDPVVAPSDYSCLHKGVLKNGRALTLEEIHTITRQFIDGARRAYAAGYDGVELHGCHGYLLCQFMNRRVNRRTDAYRSDDMLILDNIMSGIRKVTPPEFIMGIRLGVFEPTLADSIAHARWLEDHGIDFIDASYGFTYEMDKEVPEDYPLLDIHYGAQVLKGQVSVPVFAVYGIDSAARAQQVLDVTGVDMVDIGRGTLVNYSWAKDALAGRDTGRCLNCPECMWRIDASRCAGRRLLQRQRQIAEKQEEIKR